MWSLRNRRTLFQVPLWSPVSVTQRYTVVTERYTVVTERYTVVTERYTVVMLTGGSGSTG